MSKKVYYSIALVLVAGLLFFIFIGDSEGAGSLLAVSCLALWGLKGEVRDV